jgi:hypothetical protein
LIPTIVLLGLVLGRWWWLPLVIAAVGWPLVLVTTETTSSVPAMLSASALAVANAGVGVLVHQAVLGAVRVVRRRRYPCGRA